MKKRLLLLLGIASLSLSAQWTKQPDFGGSIRYAAMDFTLGTDAYIIGGLIENSTGFVAYDELWKYNTQTGNWTQLANYPGGSVYGGIAFMIDSVAYVGLGSDENSFRGKQIWAFDTRTSQWTRKSNFPGLGRTFSFSYEAGGKGYVGCGDRWSGQTRIYMNDFWEYDPQTDSWTQKAGFPNARVGMSAMSIGGKGYAGLGDDGAFFYNDFYSYDAGSDSWVVETSFPGSNRSFCHTTSDGQNGYLMGGEDLNQNYTNEMWIFNPAFNKWDSSVNFTGTARVSANFFLIGNTFYYGLGLIGFTSSQGAKDFWEYEQSSVGLQSFEEPGYKAYPNPADRNVFIDFEEAPSTETRIQILDLSGRILNSWSTEGQSQLNLDVGAIPAGSYILQIESPGQVERTKLILQ